MGKVMVLRHVPEEALGQLETQLRAGGLDLQVIYCFDEDWPLVERAGFDPRGFSGLVVMGGPMNVEEVARYPFLATEVDWLRRAVAAGLPTLGTCLGGQLLAKALGARVYKNRVKEIGWYELELLPSACEDPLLAGSPNKETVFEWHADTFDLPSGAVHLARTSTCAQQAFRYGPSAWGLQFHLEMTGEMVRDWLVQPEMCAEVAAAPGIDPHEISRRAPAALAASAGLVARVFGRFAAICRQHSLRR
jgi:GMP synthase (glutamine-hydrolysing)